MTSLTEFFNKHEDDALKGISHKNSIIKRNIIAYMAAGRTYSAWPIRRSISQVSTSGATT